MKPHLRQAGRAQPPDGACNVTTQIQCPVPDTGNSARSILAEACINNLAISQGRFVGYSAGSHPKGSVHPMALDLLKQGNMSTEGLRSKSWDEFAGGDAPS